MENTRETVILKIAHTREWIVEDFLYGSDILFYDVDQMISALSNWIQIARPWIELCSVPDCEGMWCHCDRVSDGFKSTSWRKCKECKLDLCSVHRSTCQHKYPLEPVEYEKYQLIELDESINTLTRDVLSIVLKHLIKIERRDIETYIMQHLSPYFKTFRQVMFAVNLQRSEGDSLIKVCDECPSFMISKFDSQNFQYENTGFGCKVIELCRVENETYPRYICDKCQSEYAD